jgi:DNA-directed RNA polymerase subunit RPC12/RpoP
LSFQKDCSKNILSDLLKQYYHEGKTRFYVSEFAEESKCSIEEIEDFFIPLMGVGKIEGKIELICPNCGKDLGLFGKISEIPQNVSCGYCGHEFTKSEEYFEVVLEIKTPFFRPEEGLTSCQNTERN